MKKALLLPLAALLAAPAFAQPVDLTKSQLAFTLKQMGVPMSGSFKKFAANVDFNPAQAEAGKADISIDVGSIALPTGEASAEARKKEWFNAAQFPQARFGTLPISRLAFKIGEGSWSDTGTVADNVDLKFRLVLVNP